MFERWGGSTWHGSALRASLPAGGSGRWGGAMWRSPA